MVYDMKVKVLSEKCTGCGACVAECPKVFQIEDLKAVVICEYIPYEQFMRIKKRCPADALRRLDG